MSAFEDPALLAATVSAVTAAITVGGGAIVAKLRGAAAARKADATVDRSRVIADERVSPLLLRRIETLELDRDKTIEAIRRAHTEVSTYAHKAREAYDALREAEEQRRLAEDGCQARLEQLDADHQRQRRADAARCEKEIAEVRAQVGAIAAHTARREREQGREDTGVHQLETIARRSTTPVPAPLDLPAPAPRAPLAGRTPRTTIRPSDEGGEET